MTDTEDLRCPNCDATDLVNVRLRSLDDELMECQSCKQVWLVKQEPDGTTRLVSM